MAIKTDDTEIETDEKDGEKLTDGKDESGKTEDTDVETDEDEEAAKAKKPKVDLEDPAVKTANAVGAQVTAEQADRLTAARLRWAEVQPAEPGFIEVNGHRYPLADRHRVTTHEVAAALNEGAAAGMRAAVRDNIVVLTFNNGPATVQARTIIPDIVTPFAGFEFGFVAQQVRQ